MTRKIQFQCLFFPKHVLHAVFGYNTFYYSRISRLINFHFNPFMGKSRKKTPKILWSTHLKNKSHISFNKIKYPHIKCQMVQPYSIQGGIARCSDDRYIFTYTKQFRPGLFFFTCGCLSTGFVLLLRDQLGVFFQSSDVKFELSFKML